MASPIIVTGTFPCSKCGGVISHAAIREGNYFGNESNGYTCIECMLKQLDAITLFGQELSTLYCNTDYPCARCGKAFLEGYLVEIDGKIGELCDSCGTWYFHHGGIPKGTEAEWILKLR